MLAGVCDSCCSLCVRVFELTRQFDSFDGTPYTVSNLNISLIISHEVVVPFSIDIILPVALWPWI
jgi:hypothetical protein